MSSTWRVTSQSTWMVLMLGFAHSWAENHTWLSHRPKYLTALRKAHRRLKTLVSVVASWLEETLRTWVAEGEGDIRSTEVESDMTEINTTHPTHTPNGVMRVVLIA